MDQLILAEKIESLRRCIQRIEDKKTGQYQSIDSEYGSAGYTGLNLTRAVQLCADIGSHIISTTNKPSPQTMGEVFTILHELGAITSGSCEQLKKAIGFRNIAVHHYEVINWEIVYAICQNSLQDFRRFAQEISRYAAL